MSTCIHTHLQDMYMYMYAYNLGVLEQALGWLPLGLGLVMEDEPSMYALSRWMVW